MHPRMSLKHKVYIFFIMTVAGSLLVLNSMFDVVHCNLRRDHKSTSDRYYQSVRDKITKLEKEEYKDATTVSRLAEQYNLIGTYYLDRHLWEMAIDAYNNSMKYGNLSANAFYSLGLAYANLGAEKNSAEDYNRAEFNYRKAVSIDGNLLDAKYALAILLFYQRENGRDEAMTLINEILARNRAYYPARFANGRFNYELGNKEKALSIYQELSADIDRLPVSGISNDYKAECNSNITRIMTELSMR